MKETVQLTDYANMITQALPRGILLNTMGERFNSMVIGWGALGTCWSLPTFTVYVRESRFTKSLLDRSGEFTVSVPLGAPDREINRICGTLSGRDLDKAAAAGLTLTEPETVGVPGVKEYPLTLECKVLYAQKQEPDTLPDGIVARYYPQDVDGSHSPASRDPHTAYIGQITAAYILR